MVKKDIVLGQDKNYSGKIPTKELESAINKLKLQYQEHYDDTTKVIGFEINGGTGLTKKGNDKINEFKDWAKEKGLDAEYNSNSDLDKMKNELRNRVDNKNKNLNK